MTMAGLSVVSRLHELRQRITSACERGRRDPASVHLLAVSKFQSVGDIRAAYECGQFDFGENFVQEAMLKQEQLDSLRLHWHFIGRIQSNKVKMIANRFVAIHSVDRFSTALHLSQMTDGSPQGIFIQFNVANEESKGGASELDLENLIRGIAECPNLRILGLMVMPPLHANPENSRPYFARAREHLPRLRALLPPEMLARHPLDQLSMGTSHDFEVAIEEGANWVRIGNEIFGPRQGSRALN